MNAIILLWVAIILSLSYGLRLSSDQKIKGKQTINILQRHIAI